MRLSTDIEKLAAISEALRGFQGLRGTVVRERKAKPKGGKRTALIDPEVRDRLDAAAAAAGLQSIEQLADLVADSGALALPPEGDGVSEVYSIQDLGVQMRSRLSSVLPADRPGWFAKLVEVQQVALVSLLRARGYSSTVVARDFGITEIKVNKHFAKHADELGAQVVNIRLNTLVGHMQLVSERASEGAMEKKDWGTYWRIQKEVIAVLQSLGIVKKAIQKVEVAHTFDDQKSAELAAILDIERKQHARREELKQADFEVLDPVPPIALPVAATSMEVPFDE